jgi:hypothetical protein
MLPPHNILPHVQKAVCCASGAFDKGLSSFTYNGVGSGTVNGRIDWTENYPTDLIASGEWPDSASFCPIGKYSCKSVHNVSGSHLLPGG